MTQGRVGQLQSDSLLAGALRSLRPPPPPPPPRPPPPPPPKSCQGWWVNRGGGLYNPVYIYIHTIFYVYIYTQQILCLNPKATTHLEGIYFILFSIGSLLHRNVCINYINYIRLSIEGYTGKEPRGRDCEALGWIAGFFSIRFAPAFRAGLGPLVTGRTR